MQDSMKVNILGPALFLPENDNGVNKTTFNVLKNQMGIEVDFFYPANTAKLPALPVGFEHVTLRPILDVIPRQISWFSKLLSLLSLRPFISDTSKNLQIQAQNFQSGPLVIVGLTNAGVIEYLPESVRRQTLLIPIDCLSYFYESRIQNEPFWLKRWLYRFDAWKARRFEASLYSQVKKSLFVSPHDAKFAQELSNSECHGLPYGVDFQKFDHELSELGLASNEGRDLIFTGNFDYGPNIAGALFLIDHVMPILRKRKLEVRLILAGGNPVSQIKSRACADIIVTGFVESLTKLIRSARIFLSPIFFGAGVKTKVLEAMYLESIVVGTPESFYAIEAVVGEDVISVEDKKNPKAWADIIEKILERPGDYKKFGSRAKEAILKNHRWEHVRELYKQQFLALEDK
jgi:glycosyltransferase involved in cell wall biosynthesis